MKQYKSYKNQILSSKLITIVEEYTERICCYKQASGSGSFVVDFTLTIKPNGSNEVNIFYLEDENTLIAIQPISDGIDRFILELNSSNVYLKGIDLIIKNAIVHPTDYKSRAYDTQTFARLRSLFFKNGKYLLLDANTTDLNVINIDFPYKHIFYLYENLEIRKVFTLPNTLEKILLLSEKTIIQKQFFIYGEQTDIITIEIASERYSHRHLNEIWVYSKNTPESIKLLLSINDVITKFIDDIYGSNYNIMTFHIAVVSVETENPYFSAGVDFQNDLFWFLKTLFFTFNEIKQI